MEIEQIFESDEFTVVWSGWTQEVTTQTASGILVVQHVERSLYEIVEKSDGSQPCVIRVLQDADAEAFRARIEMWKLNAPLAEEVVQTLREFSASATYRLWVQ